MSNIFIVVLLNVSILPDETCVEMYFVYTMLYITEVHSFFLVQYCTVIAIVVYSQIDLIGLYV